jgi:hypothetical protein
MTPEQMPRVGRAVQRRPGTAEREVFEHAARLLKSCGTRLSCYVVALSEPEHQEGPAQLAGIKAALTLGVLGNASARDAIVQRYRRIDSPVIRFWAAQAIAKLTPERSSAVANALRELGESEEKRRGARDLPLEQVRLRVEQRARP